MRGILDSVRWRALLGSSILLLPACGRAQHRAPAPHAAAIPAPRSTPMVRGAGSGNVTIIINNNSPALTNLPVVSASSIPVPGLGFDIPHLAATRGAAAVGGGFSQGTGIITGLPFLESGFFIPTAPVIVIQIPPIVIQQPIIVQPAVPAVSPEPAAETAPARATSPDEPPQKPAREASEYVFVRRDGALLFAVAFLREKDRLEYITREGQRRSVALGTLDLDATQLFNEERGLTFRLPA